MAEDTVFPAAGSRTLEAVEHPEPHAGHEPADPFAQIVRALTREDPRFVRRVSPPTAGGFAAGDLMILAGLLATVLLGVLPLALGLQAGVTALVAVGALGCLVLPVGAPIAVRAVLWRLRPLRP